MCPCRKVTPPKEGSNRRKGLGTKKAHQISCLKKVYTKLQWVKEKAPQLFAGEKVFVREELAFAFSLSWPSF